MPELQYFIEDLQAAAEDVALSNHRTFKDRLRAWLRVIDEFPEALAFAGKVEDRETFADWLEAMPRGRGIGGGIIRWPTDRSEKLGRQLSLLRHLAERKTDIDQFSLSFAWAGKSLNDTNQKIVVDYFEPTQRDFLRAFEREIERRGHDALSAPAADRIVSLDHNSVPHRELEAQLIDLETSLAQANDFPGSPADQTQIAAEIGAGRRLLRASQVRLSALTALLVPALKWIATQSMAGIIGSVALSVAGLLLALFGIAI